MDYSDYGYDQINVSTFYPQKYGDSEYALLRNSQRSAITNELHREEHDRKQYLDNCLQQTTTDFFNRRATIRNLEDVARPFSRMRCSDDVLDRVPVKGAEYGLMSNGTMPLRNYGQSALNARLSNMDNNTMREPAHTCQCDRGSANLLTIFLIVILTIICAAQYSSNNVNTALIDLIRYGPGSDYDRRFSRVQL